MSAARAIADLRARGVALTTDGDRVRIDAPEGAITPAERERLAEHKAALLTELEAEAATAALAALEADLTARQERLLELYAAGGREQAGALHAEVKRVVADRWLPAKVRWARALAAVGRLDPSWVFLLRDNEGRPEGPGVRGQGPGGEASR